MSILSRFSYDPETGHILELSTGEIAGSMDKDGYLRIYHEGKNYMASHIAYYFVWGFFPVSRMYHINGLKFDNRWVNLTDDTYYRHKREKRYRARVVDRTGVHILGYFPSRDEADKTESFYRSITS